MTITKDELDGLLNSMESYDGKKALLNKLYRPGEEAVADYLISGKYSLLDDDKRAKIMTQEIAYAQNNGNITRLADMRESYFGHLLQSSEPKKLKEEVITWDDTTYANRAIEHLLSEKHESRRISGLKLAAEIAQSLGKGWDEDTYLEESIGLSDKIGNPSYEKVDALERLGRHEEAINICIENNKIGEAIRSANEFFPIHIKEFARKCVQGYEIGNKEEKEYLRCAKLAGKTRTAKKRLIEKIPKWAYGSPGSYAGWVDALVELKCPEEAELLVKNIDDNFSRGEKAREYWLSGYGELAELYHSLGKTENVKETCLKVIHRLSASNDDPTTIQNYIENAITLTGDSSTFLKKSLQFYEYQGRYDLAANVSREIGLTDKVQAYEKMWKLTQGTQ